MENFKGVHIGRSFCLCIGVLAYYLFVLKYSSHFVLATRVKEAMIVVYLHVKLFFLELLLLKMKKNGHIIWVGT